MTPEQIRTYEVKKQVEIASGNAQELGERHAFRTQADFVARLTNGHFSVIDIIACEALEPLDAAEEEELREHLLNLAGLCLALAARRRVPEAVGDGE